MPLKYFIGIDVSKATLDAAILSNGVLQSQHKIDNTPKEIKAWLRQLSASPGVRQANVLFCLEHSGLYAEHIVTALEKKKLKTWLESSMQIKKSLGMQRGKSDRIDAVRIARYAYLHRASFRPLIKPRLEIEQLKNLTGLRFRLISAHQQLKLSLRETFTFLKKERVALLRMNCASSIDALEADLKQTNAAILSVVRSDETLKHLYEIVTSVDYIGPVVGTEIIVTTNEFRNFSNARKFACYCGVVPFEHTSGTSLKGKARVSKMANKRMRSLLHMAAVASVKYPGELRDYFLRKVGEGHPKMCVLNAIRNKLIHRIFVCVKEDRKFIRKAASAVGEMGSIEASGSLNTSVES